MIDYDKVNEYITTMLLKSGSCAQLTNIALDDLFGAKNQVISEKDLHDGIEYIDIPLPEQRERYRDFVDYGADGVFVHHPHVPQGWEVYKGRPIFYSLGNFFFNSKNTPDYKTSKRY